MLSLLLFAALATEPAPPPKPAPTHAPTGKWVVEFADERCHATRRFAPVGHPDGPGVQMIFAPRPLSDKWNTLYLLVPAADASRFEDAGFSVVGAASAALPLQRRALAVGGDVLFSTGFDLDQYAALEAGSIQLAGKKMAAIIPLAGFPAVRRTLAKCLDGLMAGWGFPADYSTKVASPPRISNGNVATFVRDDDYPADALRANAQGEAEAMLTVDERGRGAACRILRSSGNWQIDDATCSVVRSRARFVPARDLAGNPVAAPYVYWIRWVIPTN